MKTFKKILVLFTFVLLIGALTACSSINKISKNFDKAGYAVYQYNFRGGSLLFGVVDNIVDDLNITIEITTMTTEEPTDIVTTSTITTLTTITTNPIASVIGFKAFAFSNGRDKVAIVLEFVSETRMREVLNESPALQAVLQGLDEADYINGNCLLIADQSYYQEVVDIFQGRYIPPITTVPTSTATTGTTS